MTSGSAGWIQYWPRAMSCAVRPKLIAWISGWISDDAWWPMMWAPRILPGGRSAMSLHDAGGVLHRPAVGGVAVVLDLGHDVEARLPWPRPR